jgi:hypothetical protein
MTLFPQTGTTAVVALAFSGSALADDTILSKWSGEYSAKTGTKLDYQPIGSGRGIVQIKASAVDFGASDAPLKPEDLKNSDLGQFPRVIGSIVPVVNIEGVNWPESSAVWRYQARSGRLASRTRQIYLRRADLRCRYCYPRLLASPHGKCRLPPTRFDSTPRHRACCSPARLPRRRCGAPLNCPCRRASPNSASSRRRWQGSELAGVCASASVSGRRGYLATRVCRRPSTHPRRALP